MVGKIVVTSTMLAAFGLIVVLNTTNPSSAGPVGLLAVFFLLYVVAIGAMTELLWAGSRVVRWVNRRLATKRPSAVLSVAKAYYFSTVLALGPVMLLALQSIGSLGMYEAVLVLIFLVVGTLYISRRSTA